MKIVSLCGSLGSGSANRAALTHAGEHIVATCQTDRMVDAPIDHIPTFDPRRADEPPEAVRVFGALLESADGVMLAAPEYAGGLAGGMKNALDWMVGSASIYHRPFVILSAGTTGGIYAIDQLVRTLSWQGVLVVDTLGIAAPRTKIDSSGRVFDVDTARDIEQWADHLVRAVSGDSGSLLKRVSDVVSRFGIDPARFGDLG